MRSTIAGVILAAALAGVGCTATVATPDLVYVSPGVQVIADYDEPIFYSDGYYWRYGSGVWYRSPRYTGGWVYATPPVAVLRIDRPYAYRHYRGGGWAGHPRQAAPAPGGWRGNPTTPPPAAGGWRGNPTTPPPSGGGWRGNPPPRVESGRAPAFQPPPARRATPAPAPAQRPRGGGWRGQHDRR